jgi:hypothetical protein
MIIVDRNGKKRRNNGYEVWRKKGTGENFLMLLFDRLKPDNHLPVSMGGWWHIPVEHGGRLAMTGPDYRECYPVSWAKLPEDFCQKALVAIEHIETHGTPMENDESVF